MRIDIVTIFPELIRGALGYSILARAQEAKHVEIVTHDLRDYTSDKRRTIDFPPYGGGAGMVMKPEPVFDAVEAIPGYEKARIILMTPQGRPFSQPLAKELSTSAHVVLICGHYEGFDERIRQHLATEEISIGDYVLTGGELPALVIVDAVTRLLPGVLGNEESLGAESFESDLLEYPQYTRPAEYRGWPVPEVLLSGHHAEIAKWRLAQQEDRTQSRRPDLWARYSAAKRERDSQAVLAKRNRRIRAIQGADGSISDPDQMAPVDRAKTNGDGTDAVAP